MNGDFFQFEREGDVLVIMIRGEAGSLAMDLLGSDMHDIAREIQAMDVPRVVIDFRQHAYFGSVMLEALLNIWHAVREKHGRMAVYNVSRVGRELLGLAHFNDLWPLCNSRSDAVAAVHKVLT